MRFRNALATALAAVALCFAGPARATVLELRPALNVPATCSVTPVYGSDTGPALPWIDAQPARVSRIRFTFAQRIGPHGTYTPMAAGGQDVLISAPSHGVTIIGRRVSGTPERFSALVITGSYQRLAVPDSGCWELQLTAGKSTGSMTIWVLPAAP